MDTSLVGYEGAGAAVDGRGIGCVCVTDHNIGFGRGGSLSPGKTLAPGREGRREGRKKGEYARQKCDERVEVFGVKDMER